MRYNPKLSIKQYLFNNFSGGMNTIVNANIIADNELADAYNVEYNNSGILESVPCIQTLFSENKPLPPGIVGVYYTNLFGGKILYWKNDLSIYDGATNSKIGVLNGSIPYFCVYDGILLIASGGKLQKYDGIIISDVAAKHNGFTIPPLRTETFWTGEV